MSFLCEFSFGILVIKLGFNLHGFNLEADNQSCNQNPVIGRQVFLMPGQKAEACGVLCAAYCNRVVSTGENQRQNEGDLLQECPFQAIQWESQHRDDKDCLSSRIECETHSCGLASH